MSHQVLYRKYRPHSFEEVIGQGSVIKALEGAIKNNAVAHAYLFSGSRGIGKTSIARIFAEAIGTTPNDMYEIDAASNRGIDDVRALRDAVAILPFESEFKVYIIDEVHMLTKEAFNALLKTLEEPPKHVVFILATTEAHKIPETIISRCQVFEFKRPTVDILKDTIITVAKKEGFDLEPAGAELIALVGDGSFRDTNGVLERVVAGLDMGIDKETNKTGKAGKKITREMVEEATGSPKSELVRAYVGALIEKDSKAAFAAIETIRKQSFDPKLFLDLSLSLARLALMTKIGVSEDVLAQASEEDRNFANDLVKNDKGNADSVLIKQLLGAYEYIGVVGIQELPLELVAIDLIGEAK